MRANGVVRELTSLFPVTPFCAPPKKLVTIGVLVTVVAMVGCGTSRAPEASGGAPSGDVADAGDDCGAPGIGLAVGASCDQPDAACVGHGSYCSQIGGTCSGSGETSCSFACVDGRWALVDAGCSVTSAPYPACTAHGHVGCPNGIVGYPFYYQCAAGVWAGVPDGWSCVSSGEMITNGVTAWCCTE